MFNPWESGSPLYRRLLVIGMITLGLGIILAIIGALTSYLPVSWTGLAVLFVGIVIHLSAQWVRMHQARQRMRDSTASLARKKNK